MPVLTVKLGVIKKVQDICHLANKKQARHLGKEKNSK